MKDTDEQQEAVRGEMTWTVFKPDGSEYKTYTDPRDAINAVHCLNCQYDVLNGRVPKYTISINAAVLEARHD